MILDFEAIKSITAGAVEIRQGSDGIHFFKCTASQLAAWEAVSPNFAMGAQVTTGVRLDFHTTSSYVRVGVASGQKYEIKIDGLVVRQFLAENDIAPTELYAELGESGAWKHVVIILPSHSIGVVRFVELEDGAQVKAHTFDRNILFLGDSITQGWDAKFDSNSFAYCVSDFLNANCVIHGVGGSHFRPSTVQENGFDADLVFVAYGTNHFGCGRPLSALTEDMTEYVQKVQSVYPNAQVVIISPTFRQDHTEKVKYGTFEECCDCVKQTAKALGVACVDGGKILPKLDEFFADLIHPNDLGFTVYALNLLRELRALGIF